jgi:integrase
MARVKFSTKTNINPANIYVRFFHSRDFDLNCKTGFLINPKFWSNKQQRVKTTSANAYDQIINPKLNDLKETIITQFNLSYNSGKKIDKKWLQKIIFHFNKQPLSEEENPKYYFVPYFDNFVEESKTRINPATNQPIDSKTISKYNTTLQRVKDFEEFTNSRLRINDIDMNFHGAFLSYLVKEWMYGGTTNEKHISIIKGVIRNAKVNGLETNIEVEDKRFSVKREKTYDTYLTEEEIQKIYNLNFSQNEDKLDEVRDWIMVGVWTGLRVSDFKRLNQLHIRRETIEIETTKNNGEEAVIPIHPQLQKVLSKRNGKFPPKMSEQDFNKKMKIIGERADITKIIKGKKPVKVTLPNGEEVYRDKLDYYPKNELLSSHTCRRSFATNLYGKLPNRTIMAITTHKSEAQFEKYLKQSQLEHVEALKDYWSKN